MHQISVFSSLTTRMPPASIIRPLSSEAEARSSTSLWRLRGYLRPHLWSLIVMFAAALLAVVVGLLIPGVPGRPCGADPRRGNVIT